MSDASLSPDAGVATPSDRSSPGDAVDDSELRELMSDEEGGSSKNAKRANGLSDDEMADEGDDAGGLFGSGSEDEGGSISKRRKLSDAELDSGDDENRHDRMGDDAQEEGFEQKEVLSVSLDIGRHAVPSGSDGELYLLKNPNVVGNEPKAFTLRSFQPPNTGHNAKAPVSTFSAAQTSNSTVRWKRSLDNPAMTQSNSRIVRWSDGSLTLQIASNPLEQLQLPGKPLAPVQRNPVKPTPTSTDNAKGPPLPYDARQDSHTYLASVHQDVSFVQVTNHVTASLTVQSTVEENDDALLRLQENMAAAIRANKGNKGSSNIDGPAHIRVTEDPELAKRKAEIAEREKMRAEKRRQNQEQRQRERQGGVSSRFGSRVGPGLGLTVGGLEEEGGSRPRAKPTRKPRRRNSEYSEDEEDYTKGKTREDEYDEDDGFLVGDEEPDEVSDDGDDEEVLEDDADAEGEEEEVVQERPARSPKRPRDGDEEATTGGRRRRKIVDDDDDE